MTRQARCVGLAHAGSVRLTRRTRSNLKKLALRGVIRLDDGVIHVLDLQALLDLAG